MKVATTVFERTVSIAIVAMLAAALIITAGCPEGMDMADDVMMGEPPMIEDPGETSPEPVMTGEMKKPDPTTETAGTTAEDPAETSDPETPATKPEPEVPQEPVVTPEPTRPIPTGLSEERAREKAYDLVKNDLYPVWERGKYTDETWDPYVARIRDLLDLERSEAITVLISIKDIHLQEHPEDEELSLAGDANGLHLFAEYLSLTYQHPEKTHEEILVLFEEVVKSGGTMIHWFAVDLHFGILDPKYIQAKDIAWTVFDRWAELLRAWHAGDLTEGEYVKELDRMYARETGLAYFDASFLATLEGIYGTAYPDMDDFVSRESTVAGIIPLIWEFMYVALQNPDSDRRQIKWDFDAYIRENPVYAIGPEGYPVHAIELTVKRRYQWPDATFLN